MSYGDEMAVGCDPWLTFDGSDAIPHLEALAWGDGDDDEPPWMQVVNAVQSHPNWDEEVADGPADVVDFVRYLVTEDTNRREQERVCDWCGTYIPSGEGIEDEGLWCSQTCLDTINAQDGGPAEDCVYVVGTRIEEFYPDGRHALVVHSIHHAEASAIRWRDDRPYVIECWQKNHTPRVPA